MISQAKNEPATLEYAAPPRSPWVVSFIATLIAMFCLQASNLGFSPLFPPIQSHFEMTFSTLGQFKGLNGLISIFVSVAAGLSVKRFGEKTMLLISLSVVALGHLILSQAPNLVVAFGGRGVWSVGYRIALVCVMTAIALTCPKHLRGRCMGILGAVASLSAVVCAPFATELEKALGWRLAVLGFSGLAIVGVLIFASMYRNTNHPLPPKPAGGGGDDTTPAPRGGAFTSPLVWAVAVLCGFAGVTSLTTGYEIPGAVKELFPGRISPAFLISGGFFVAIFLNLLFGFLMDRFHKWRVMTVLAVILIFGSLIMVSSNLIVFGTGAIIVIAVGLVAIQQSYSIAAEVFQGKETGNVMGIVSFMTGVVNFLVPWALGKLRDATHGFNVGWLLLASISCVTLTLVMILWRKSALVDKTDVKGGQP